VQQLVETAKQHLASSAQTSSGGGDGKEIIIGFSAPLTGPQSHYGEDYKSGVQMAIDEANEQGITINGGPATFKLDAQDDGSRS
jgi:branched-chain amino acid transport system substrate-binding protein